MNDELEGLSPDEIIDGEPTDEMVRVEDLLEELQHELRQLLVEFAQGDEGPAPN